MSALADTAARVGAVAEHLHFEVAPPEGPGWFVLSSVLEAGLLDRLAAELVESVGRRDVAGSYLGSHLTSPVVSRAVSAVALDRRCPDLDAATVSVHLHADGWFDGVAFGGATVAVLAGDPVAGEPGTVELSDLAELRTWWAVRTAAAVTPLLDAVRARLGFGRRGLWGSVADAVARASLTMARVNGVDPATSWHDAAALVDALAQVAPVPLVRPTPFMVEWSGGTSCLAVRGTCCLYFRTVADPDPRGEGFCTSCPFMDDDHRHRRWSDWLEEEAAVHAAATTSGRDHESGSAS